MDRHLVTRECRGAAHRDYRSRCRCSRGRAASVGTRARTSRARPAHAPGESSSGKRLRGSKTLRCSCSTIREGARRRPSICKSTMAPRSSPSARTLAHSSSCMRICSPTISMSNRWLRNPINKCARWSNSIRNPVCSSNLHNSRTSTRTHLCSNMCRLSRCTSSSHGPNTAPHGCTHSCNSSQCSMVRSQTSSCRGFSKCSKCSQSSTAHRKLLQRGCQTWRAARRERLGCCSAGKSRRANSKLHRACGSRKSPIVCGSRNCSISISSSRISSISNSIRSISNSSTSSSNRNSHNRTLDISSNSSNWNCCSSVSHKMAIITRKRVSTQGRMCLRKFQKPKLTSRLHLRSPWQ
mmetsp:Transcript_103031/g.193863  ORF Transcript_103031/g.193863 Transcript_103031/m.193863 type:complete len:352 (+) Transcript_103031:265-1320(+)